MSMATEEIGAMIVRKGRCGEDGYSEPYALLDDGREMPMGWNMSGPVFEIGTRGVASFITTESAGLWRFEPAAPFLSRDEIDALNRARRVLLSVSERSTDLAWRAPSTVRESGPRAQDYGRVGALADVAEEGIFDVLNSISTREMAELNEGDVILGPEDDE